MQLAQRLVTLYNNLRYKVSDRETCRKEQHDQKVSEFLKGFVIHNVLFEIRPFRYVLGELKGLGGNVLVSKLIKLG